ncbi:MAG: hypothetical protein HY320_09275 [Armatimonadetes bacterium]|nr:hypothetical protein [Armatimonadota bacterium]
MSATQGTSGPSSDIERLIEDMFDSEDVVFTIAAGDNLSVAELMGKSTPFFRGGTWTVETAHWHIHARLDAIKRVRFVREPSSHAAGQESLSICFIGSHGESPLRCYFTELYDDQNRPVVAQFDRWEELRQKYGRQDEVLVENGAIVTPSCLL